MMAWCRMSSFSASLWSYLLVAVLVRPYSKITPDGTLRVKLNTRHPETAFNLPLVHLTELAATGVGMNT